jgi:hypothetical protein
MRGRGGISKVVFTDQCCSAAALRRRDSGGPRLIKPLVGLRNLSNMLRGLGALKRAPSEGVRHFFAT